MKVNYHEFLMKQSVGALEECTASEFENGYKTGPILIIEGKHYQLWESTLPDENGDIKMTFTNGAEKIFHEDDEILTYENNESMIKQFIFETEGDVNYEEFSRIMNKKLKEEGEKNDW